MFQSNEIEIILWYILMLEVLIALLQKDFKIIVLHQQKQPCLIWAEQLRALHLYNSRYTSPPAPASLKCLLNRGGCRRTLKWCDGILIFSTADWLLKSNLKHSALRNRHESKGLMAHFQTFQLDWRRWPSDPFFRRYYVTIASSTFLKRCQFTEKQPHHQKPAVVPPCLCCRLAGTFTNWQTVRDSNRIVAEPGGVLRDGSATHNPSKI